MEAMERVEPVPRRRRTRRERSRAARVAALARLVTLGPDAIGVEGRNKFLSRFAAEVDAAHPDATPDQRQRLIAAARSVYFARLGRRRWSTRKPDQATD